MASILKVNDLYKDFRGVPVIEKWSFEVRKGERMALLGPSGCGKTTFLRIVAGLENFQGRVEVLAKRLGYVFQEPRLIPWKTIEENLKIVGYGQDRISFYLERLGLKGYESYYPWQLSEGMKQRVNFIRALLVEPDLLLLDEPFDALDLKMKIHVMDLLLEMWRKKENTILFVTHNVKEAAFLANRILLLSGRPSRIVDAFRIEKQVGSFLDDKLFEIEREVVERILNLLR
ncbi:ABC transporter ATP-binding protein [Thermotoga sp. KOL6]|uniref:ABC transporter ATP-binding protein n=1 Tax=Thermotoga sp. KOL6 TaxID=126741 RepID=UPI000C76389E|nr:ABC transporter ATP-binding protein [Thermotoga sp. KOL6]PLV58960.1 ABC transporter ATP-binding protein [Thermotoga sp. KOL6]